MIATDEDALICDLAETYGIFNYRSLPVELAATFAVGLKADSRIMMKLNNEKVPLNTVLLAGILDRLTWLAWAKTEDGKKGRNKPQEIVKKLMGSDISQRDTASFASGKEFDEMRKRLLQEGGK